MLSFLIGFAIGSGVSVVVKALIYAFRKWVDGGDEP
jgi:hypothetical protein